MPGEAERIEAQRRQIKKEMHKKAWKTNIYRAYDVTQTTDADEQVNLLAVASYDNMRRGPAGVTPLQRLLAQQVSARCLCLTVFGAAVTAEDWVPSASLNYPRE